MPRSKSAGPAGASGLPLITGTPDSTLLIRADGTAVSRADFASRVRALAATLPAQGAVVNLCESRDTFMLGLCAAAARGLITLLPPSRAADVVADIAQRHAEVILLGDAGTALEVDIAIALDGETIDGPPLAIPAEALCVIGFTSGSTGVPAANPKTWGTFHRVNAANVATLADLAGDAQLGVVATVPPQHMYGMELSVLLPLLGPAQVHAGRPFFPQDIADALAAMPAPRLLVTTPLHLEALLESGVALPGVAAVYTATAPLPQALAARCEAAFGCGVREGFGSTETCIIARRRTARDADWSLLPGVTLTPQPEGTIVRREGIAGEVELADLVELSTDGGHFRLMGRRADMLEIAGKRASLADLSQRLKALPGMRDAALVQAPPDARGTRRLVALVSAPESLTDADIITALRRVSDPVFLPRRILRLERLPRNDTGKLPRAAIDALLAST